MHLTEERAAEQGLPANTTPASLAVNDGNVVKQQNHAYSESPTPNGASTRNVDPTNGSKVLHRSLRQAPLQVLSADGHYLRLNNGQGILDATGGAAVACIGHGNKRVQSAIVEQMNSVSYAHSLFYVTSAAEELASLLIDSTGGEMARAFFVSSGSEAMEATLKMARQYHLEKRPSEPQRTRFISRQQSYHGTTLGALSVSGHVARRALFEPLLSSNNDRVSPCFAYRGMKDGESVASYVQRLEAELDDEFQRVGPSNVAAFIAEPVVGAALGCVPAQEGYFAAVRRVCDKYGALLVLDEVMCGIGRIGPEPTERYPQPLHAWQDPLIGVAPDIMTMGKGLGGGYMPVAAMLANHKVIDVLSRGSGAFSHGQTYQGHPLACRAALEVQRIIKEQRLVANVGRQGQVLGRLLRERLRSHEHVGDIRGKGLFWGIEFVADKQTKRPFDPAEAIAMGIHELGMQRPHDISLYPGTGTADGKSGDHILVAPAYTVTEDEVAEVVDRACTVIEKFFEGRRG